jgi:hypothetical protein
MPKKQYSFWCFVVGDNTAFLVEAFSFEYIAELKEKIKEMKCDFLKGFDGSNLILTRVCYIMIYVNINVTAPAGSLHP